MHKFWLTIITLVLFSSKDVYSETYDPSLKQSVTLAIKGEALSDVVEILERQTGVRFRAARDIADQKATIFVDGKPLDQVMAGISTLFKYRWRTKTFKEKQIYELYQDPDLSPRVQHQKALDKVFEKMDAELKRLATEPVSTLEDIERWQAERRAEGISPEDLAEPEKQLAYESRRKACARLYSRMPSEALDALRAGLIVCFDLQSQEPEWKIPQDVLDAVWPSDADLANNLDGVNVQFLYRVFSASAMLDAFVVRRYKHSGERLPAMPMGTVDQETFFYKNLLEMLPKVADSLPMEPDGGVLGGKVSLDTSELMSEAGIPDQGEPVWVNRSDVLALLHKKLGLQIISDHYSRWYQWKGTKDWTARQIVDSYASLRLLPGALYSGAFWGWDGKFLYMRAEDIQRSDDAEVPNRLLRSWQEVYAKQGYLGIDELADMSLLSTEQRLGSPEMHFLRLASRDDQLYMDRGLRVYGVLTPMQRKQAFTTGVDLRKLKPEQRSAMRDPSDFGRLIMGRPVGIYENGRRVDKPEPPQANDPVWLKVRETGTTNDFYGVREGDPDRILVGDARNVEEALERARREHAELTEANIIIVKLCVYKLTIRRADGTTTEDMIRVPVATTRAKPAAR